MILSAGVFQSPQLLMLSGVGDGGDIGKFGIPVRTTCLVWARTYRTIRTSNSFGYTSNEAHFIGLTPKAVPRLVCAAFEYHRRRRGPLASNIGESGGFLEDPCGTRCSRPATALRYNGDRQPRPKATLGKGIFRDLTLLHPKSRGSVRLQSSIRRRRRKSIES